ncbi:MAG: NAD-dependent deacetylase, partial [Nitrospiria bacterium]
MADNAVSSGESAVYHVVFPPHLGYTGPIFLRRTPLDARQIDLVRKRVTTAEAVTVLTGAGISAESGIPTFRGEGGLWKQFKAEELATPEAFRDHPGIVWEWYHWRRGIIAKKHPNRAHIALVELEARVPRFTLITQNVDGLHGVAGSRNIIELHGNLWKMRCPGCDAVIENRSLETPLLPKCANCLALLRPHVVWFGEAIDPIDLQKSMKACRECDVFLVIGTSSLVQPAASFASLAGAEGAFIAEINITPSLPVRPDVYLIGKAAEIVPRLLGSA